MVISVINNNNSRLYDFLGHYITYDTMATSQKRRSIAITEAAVFPSNISPVDNNGLLVYAVIRMINLHYLWNTDLVIVNIFIYSVFYIFS